MFSAIKNFIKFCKDYIKYKLKKMSKPEKKKFKKVLKSFDGFSLRAKIARVFTDTIYLELAA